MGLILEQVETEGLAQLSYLVGDDAAGVAAVIDPRRDVGVYLDLAQGRGLRITHAIETHLHSDFISGAHELRARTGAEIRCGPAREQRIAVRPLRDGEEIHLGAVTLRAMATPGHTPEHISLLLSDAGQGETPFGVFTGDTLFNLDVGRPDLVGEGTGADLARALHQSLTARLLPLGDGTEVYPGHAAGSACGKAIGDRRRSTIGSERSVNPALADRSEGHFVDWLLADMPEPPAHYARVRKANIDGAPVLGAPPVVPPLTAPQFRDRLNQDGALVLDTRSILAFGGGHVPGALNIALETAFPTWAGRMIDPRTPLLLVVDSRRDLTTATTHLFRLGYDRLAGYLHGGMTDWDEAGLPLRRVPQWTVKELEQRRRGTDLQVLDVRSDAEWQKGHVPGARHIFVPHLEKRAGELDRTRQVATYCGTGFRASIAASLLRRLGFDRVVNVPGSWKAWTAAGLPVER